MMNKKNFLPTLFPLNRDIRKTWFVKYYPPNQKAPLKKYGRLNHLHTLRERLKEADRIIRSILEPQQAEKQQREDIITHLSALLEYKRPALARKSYQTYLSYLNRFAAWYRPAMKADHK